MLPLTFLSHAQKAAYHRDGFLVLPDFFTYELACLLKGRATYLINEFNPGDVKTAFSSGQHETRDNYFLESSDKISFFFEEGALNPEGELICEKSLSINKIGHALHDLDPVFSSFSRMHKLTCLLNDLGIAEPQLLQSMYICKQPFIGGEVTCHQDSTYLYVKNKPVTGLWFALEDATIDNGCLWAIPGAHTSPLKSRMMRTKQNTITTEIYDHRPWPIEEMVPLVVSSGSLIVLHGLLPHMSKQNYSSTSRHAYTLHVMSKEDDYAHDNWLQRQHDMPCQVMS